MSPTPEVNRDAPNRNEGGDNEISSVESPQFVIAAGSSDEGEEDDVPSGYQMLPQDPDTDGDHTDEENMDHMDMITTYMGNSEISADSSSTNQNEQSYLSVPPIQSAESSERRELWNVSKTDHEPMPDDQVHKIKSIMQNIKLPNLNIPPWARVLSEDDWKAQIVSTVTKSSNNSNVHPQPSSNKTDKDNSNGDTENKCKKH